MLRRGDAAFLLMFLSVFKRGICTQTRFTVRVQIREEGPFPLKSMLACDCVHMGKRCVDRWWFGSRSPPLHKYHPRALIRLKSRSNTRHRGIPPLYCAQIWAQASFSSLPLATWDWGQTIMINNMSRWVFDEFEALWMLRNYGTLLGYNVAFFYLACCDFIQNRHINIVFPGSLFTFSQP